MPAIDEKFQCSGFQSMVLTPYLKLHIAGTVRRGGQKIEHRMSKDGIARAAPCGVKFFLKFTDYLPSTLNLAAMP